MKGSEKAIPLKLAGKINLPFLFIVAHELKCYKCFSTISWEDCETNNEKKTCRKAKNAVLKLIPSMVAQRTSPGTVLTRHLAITKACTYKHDGCLNYCCNSRRNSSRVYH